MIKDIEEMFQKTIPLFDMIDLKNSYFPPESKPIIKEVADFAHTTVFFKENAENISTFWRELANSHINVNDPMMVFSIIAVKIADAPGFITAVHCIIAYMPHLDAIINGGGDTYGI